MKRSRIALCIGAVATLVACARKNATPGGPGAPGQEAANAASVPADPHDPCTLVSQAEAEQWLGPLAHPPFRSSDNGDPVADGKNCKFLGADGRNILMEVEWTDGKMEMKAMGMMAGPVSKVFTDDAGKTDTLEGNWDEARWLGAGGEFFALKDNVLITAKVAAAKSPIPAAADLSSKALGRIDHPLAYNGGQAATNAPKPRETGDACALLTSADVETVLGAPVEGAPTPGGRGTDTDCTWHVKGKGDLSLQVRWRNGFENFAGGKLVMGTVMGQAAGMPTASGSNVGPPKQESLKTAKPADDPGFSKMMGVLQKLAKTQGIEMNKSGGLVHDTLVAGPWAEGAIMGGMTLVAVKHDVQATLDFRILDPEQAKALMAKIMEKL